MHIKFTSKPFDKIETQCAVVTTFSDSRPLKGIAALLDWRLNGRLSEVMMKNRYQGEFGETLLLPSEGRVKARDILVFGLGTLNSFDEASLNPYAQTLLSKLDQMRAADFVMSLSDVIPDRFEWRNGVRLLVSKVHDFENLQAITLSDADEYVRDAKRRHMDFGMSIDVSFEMTS